MLRRLVLVCTAVCAVLVSLGSVGPAMALGLAHPRVVSDDPVNYTPNVGNGTVLAIATVGSRVYLGGTFTRVTPVVPAGSAPVTRRYLLAFDRATGRLLPFAPALDAPVETIAPGPNGTIIIGGQFGTVNGAAQRSLAMLRPDGTRAPTFTARTNGMVYKVLVRGNRLVAGGRFSTAGTAARANLAVFNATTGAVDAAFDLGVTEGRVKPDGTRTVPNVYEMDANATGSRLVILGNFRSVGGQRRMQIAAIDLGRNSLLQWSTQRYANDTSGPLGFRCLQVFHTPMRDVEFSPDGRFFVVVTTGGAPNFNRNNLCDTAARWETPSDTGGANSTETWFNCTGGDSLYAVAVTATASATSGGAVYVGGHQRWLDNCGGRDSPVPGHFAAPGIGAIDAVTGKAIRTWNPGRTRGVGIEELVAQPEGLYLGCDTERLAGELRARVGLFPLR